MDQPPLMQVPQGHVTLCLVCGMDGTTPARSLLLPPPSRGFWRRWRGLMRDGQITNVGDCGSSRGELFVLHDRRSSSSFMSSHADYDLDYNDDLPSGPVVAATIDAADAGPRWFSINHTFGDTVDRIPDSRAGLGFHSWCLRHLLELLTRRNCDSKDLWAFLVSLGIMEEFMCDTAVTRVPPVRIPLLPGESNPAPWESVKHNIEHLSRMPMEECDWDVPVRGGGGGGDLTGSSPTMKRLRHVWLRARPDSLWTFPKGCDLATGPLQPDDREMWNFTQGWVMDEFRDDERDVYSSSSSSSRRSVASMTPGTGGMLPQSDADDGNIVFGSMIMRKLRHICYNGNEGVTSTYLFPPTPPKPSSSTERGLYIGPLAVEICQQICDILEPTDLLKLFSASRALRWLSTDYWRDRCRRDGFACNSIADRDKELRDLTRDWRRVYFCAESVNHRRISRRATWLADEVAIFSGSMKRPSYQIHPLTGNEVGALVCLHLQRSIEGDHTFPTCPTFNHLEGILIDHYRIVDTSHLSDAQRDAVWEIVKGFFETNCLHVHRYNDGTDPITGHFLLCDQCESDLHWFTSPSFRMFF